MPKLPFPSLCWMMYLLAIRLLWTGGVCVAGWQWVWPGRSRNLGIFQSWMLSSQLKRDKGQENVNKCSLVTLFLFLLVNVIYLVFWYFKFLFWKLSICNIHNNYFENDLQEQFIIFIVYIFVNERNKTKIQNKYISVCDA